MAQEVNKPTLANMTVSEFLMANKAAQGRNGDTMLAHINPREANLLQSLGGSGSVNPYTGLREFYDSSAPGGMDGGMDGSESDGGGYGGADANNVNSPNFSALMEKALLEPTVVNPVSALVFQWLGRLRLTSVLVLRAWTLIPV